METNISLDRFVEILTNEANNLPTEKFDYPSGSKKFNSNDWYDIIFKLLTEFYPDNKYLIYLKKEETDLTGGKCWLNPIFKEKYVSNLTLIEFESLYPNIICLLYKERKLIFNNDKIGDLYCDLVALRPEIKKLQLKIAESGQDVSIIEKINLLMKLLINYFYGVLSISDEKLSKYNYTNPLFYCNDFGKINKYIRCLLDTIIEGFENHIAYIDTDEIFIYDDGVINDIEEIISYSNLPYDKEIGLEGYFTEKKHFMIFKNKKIIRLRGIKEYNPIRNMKILRNKFIIKTK